jgi:hypothetical protein
VGNADRAESGSADIGCRDLIRKAEFYKPDINALRLMAAPGLLVASAEIPGLRIDLRQHLADIIQSLTNHMDDIAFSLQTACRENN